MLSRATNSQGSPPALPSPTEHSSFRAIVTPGGRVLPWRFSLAYAAAGASTRMRDLSLPSENWKEHADKRTPPELRKRTRGLSHRRQEDIRVQDACRVERVLNAAESGNFFVAPVEMEQRLLRPADAMLGADAATQSGCEDQNSVVHCQIIGANPGDVHMDIAVSSVTEQPRGGSRIGVVHDAGDLVDEIR